MIAWTARGPEMKSIHAFAAEGSFAELNIAVLMTILSVSAGGSIEGTVQVPNVMLEGTVKGDIHATGRVVIDRKSVV